ncbi:helix-turn-helix domain-containing protein [Roseibium salinum]|nr:helix-turn-helix domain-containing protein [Roseibium salinum]
MSRQAGIGTVGKALEVLDRVAAVGRPVRFSELLAKSSHPKATLYRLLQTLVSQGMLVYDDQRQTYSLGIRLVRLAHAAWRQSSIAPIARPFVKALAETVGETVHLAQLDSGQVLYVEKAQCRRPDRYVFPGRQGRSRLLHRRGEGADGVSGGLPSSMTFSRSSLSTALRRQR